MEQKNKNKKVSDKYKSGIQVKFDLKQMNDIKNTIDDIIEKKEMYESKIQSEIATLKDKIYQITTKKSYINDFDSQDLVKKISEKIEGKELLLYKRNKVLINQLNEFKIAYNKLYSKKIIVRCGDLKEELEKYIPKIFVNLSIGIVSYDHTELTNIIDEYQDKTCCIDMCISETETPEYHKNLNNVLYVKRFPVDFNEEQYDGEMLSNHLTIGYGLTDDPSRYTYLKIEDPSEINLKFRLGDLINEDENWKPVKLFREAICNCKDNEYKRNNEKQKTKRI